MKTHIIFAWFENLKDGTSSRQGGMRDAIRDPNGNGDTILSFGSFDEAMLYLQMEVPVTLNIAQIYDQATGKYQEFKHAWVPLKPQGGK